MRPGRRVAGLAQDLTGVAQGDRRELGCGHVIVVMIVRPERKGDIGLYLRNHLRYRPLILGRHVEQVRLEIQEAGFHAILFSQRRGPGASSACRLPIGSQLR